MRQRGVMRGRKAGEGGVPTCYFAAVSLGPAKLCDANNSSKYYSKENNNNKENKKKKNSNNNVVQQHCSTTKSATRLP